MTDVPGVVERRILMRDEKYEHSITLVQATTAKIEALRMEFEDQWDPPDACSKARAQMLESVLQVLRTELGGLCHASNVALYVNVDSLLWEHCGHKP